MSKENSSVALEEAIKQLESNSRTRTLSYLNVQNWLENDTADITSVERILTVCIRDMKDDVKHTSVIVNVIAIILKKIQIGEYVKVPELVPVAVAIVNMIINVSSLNNVAMLKTMCVDTFMLFPDKTLIAVATTHGEVLKEVFNTPGHAKSQLEFRVLVFDILHKLLLILPTKEKREFIKNGMSVWFSKIIPTIVVIYTNSGTSDNLKPITVLELLTDVLVTMNYTDNPQWLPVLECICNRNKYPQVMKLLLENGNPVWYRLWIVFIKLLNNQITRNTSSVGTPINSMLPVVEAAFKMDATNRCKAFKCWSVLIDNFSKETNENCIMKRIKLIVIPLKLNNAKTEETALAKLDAWWLLITKFQTKLEKFIDVVMISFLHFCFGKHDSSGRSFVAGQLSATLRNRGVQAFVEIVGHVNCQGCTVLPRLKDRLLNTKYLIDYWKDWVHSMKTALKYSLDHGQKQYVQCLWNSFLLTIAKLPDSNVKRGVLNELLFILQSSLQDSVNENVYDEMVLNLTVTSLFDEELKLTQLLKPKEDEENGPLNKVISIISDPLFKSVYERYSMQETVAKLSPLTDFILHGSLKCITLKKVLHNLPSNDAALKLWIALGESLFDANDDICPKDLCCMLLWPLNSTNMFTDVKYAAKTWYNLYDTNILKLSKTDTDKEIQSFLLSCNIVIHSSIYFTLCAIIAILKNGLSKKHCSEYEKESELLKTLLNRVDNYEYIEEVFPKLIDTLVIMLNNVTSIVNEKITEATLISVKIVFKLIVPVFKNRSDVTNIVTLLTMLLKSVESIFEVESYSKFYPIIVDNLKQDYVPFESQPLLKDAIKSIVNRSLIKEKENIKLIHDCVDLTMENVPIKTKLNANTFTTPNIKDVPKRNKKRESSIVNTVVENGEEFVVVKSNWKFNPRKLTENQKEKFQRKREDIPALYQDLSQSQDEFKMTVWKTDSQDNSTTSKSNSKSTNEGVDSSNILKNLVSTDVVPKIMENIFADKDAKEIVSKSGEDSDKKTATKESSKQLTNLTPNNKKTPRMALKDRVFKNVRNLIEKSTTPSCSKEIGSNQAEDILKTPTSKTKDCGNLVNSAPSSLMGDRPSRVKRKPRKFDDTELFMAKKRRHSQSDSPTNENEDINLLKNDIVKSIEVLVNSGNQESFSTVVEVNIVKCEEDLPQVIENVPSEEEPICNKIKIDAKTVSDASEQNATVVDKNIETVEPTSEVKEQDNNGDKNEITLEPERESTSTVDVKDSKEVYPQKLKTIENDKHTPTVKKSSVRKSRIEKELAIDMVEGHPFLNTPSTTEKRKTRKNLSSPVNCLRKKNTSEKLNKSKSDPKTPLTVERKEKSRLKKSNSDGLDRANDSVSSTESVPASEESCSEDIIESSQDSTLTTISVIRKTPKRLPIVSIEKMQMNVSNDTSNDAAKNLLHEGELQRDFNTATENIDAKCEKSETSKKGNNKFEAKQDDSKKQMNVTNVMETQDICEEISSGNLHIARKADCSFVTSESLLHQDSKDDTELPRNKTAIDDKNESELTENMDTQSMVVQDTCDVSMINDGEQSPHPVSCDENVVGTQTQELADADTQPNETTDLDNNAEVNATNTTEENTEKKGEKQNSTSDMHLHVTENTMSNLDATNNSLTNTEKSSDVSSPFKGDAQRKQDFLNNTIEISPIKTVSPEREKNSPSPDRSNDYVVIKLTSPVQSNGEPFERCSPEFFTEDKISPDKRDQSPPRTEVAVTNTSPSSSLSLKKNRPQVRSGGRAAQMLGLCVPDKLNPLMNSERLEIDEGKRNSPCNTPARRNLRILYNSVGDTSDNVVDNEDSDNFLKLKKPLPSISSSPSGPILKRKLAEITDEGTISPANKRKRVSFHDPPVSTTVTVHKYIEPCGVRSPQNSAQKRLERQARMQNNLKSPKRLDNLFSLETVLTKTVESFTGVDLSLSNSDDTQITSLDQTPAAEIVTTSELNDTDPICPELLDCKDAIGNIATELSSPAMKTLLVKELEGKVETIGDLAKMTELEVNRLCIKAPKVKVAKKVLTDYAANIEGKDKDVVIIEDDLQDVEIVTPQELRCVEIAVQTNNMVSTDVEMQTLEVGVSLVSTQTEETATSSIAAQTDESGSKTTAEIIRTCLEEKSDFVTLLSEQLDESSVQLIAKKLSFNAATDTLMSKTDDTNSKIVLDRLLAHHSQETNEQITKFAFLQDYLCEKFASKDLILFCSDLLKKLYEKTA